MWIFRNYLFAVILTGVITQIVYYLYKKSYKPITASYLTFASVGIFLLPIMSWIIGFDVAFAEYLSSLLIWLVIDLALSSKNKEKI